MKSRVIKKIIHYTWRPFILNYLKKERSYNHNGLHLTIKPGVFHPRFFFSSLLLIEFLNQKEVAGKKLLDLGAGAGLLALCAARKNASVTAVDISNSAVENIRINAQFNKVNLTVLQSDLFKSLENQRFDYIFVNPPYYKKKPVLEHEHAWYCGEGMEYFHKLFNQLPHHLNPEARLFMILSEDCDISEISAVAKTNDFEITEVFRKKKWWEWNYIFEIKPFVKIHASGEYKDVATIKH